MNSEATISRDGFSKICSKTVDYFLDKYNRGEINYYYLAGALKELQLLPDEVENEIDGLSVRLHPRH